MPRNWEGMLVKHWSRDGEVASSRAGRSGGRVFFSRVNFLCWLSFVVHSIPTLLQWHIKDPCHSAKSADGRLYLNTCTPLAQQSQRGLTMLSKHSVGTYQGNKLTHNSSGKTWPQSSQIAEPLWTDPGLTSGISVLKLTSL